MRKIIGDERRTRAEGFRLTAVFFAGDLALDAKVRQSASLWPLGARLIRFLTLPLVLSNTSQGPGIPMTLCTTTSRCARRYLAALAGFAAISATATSVLAAQSAPMQRVEGTAYDSLGKRPLSGAFVAIPAIGRVATTDDKGRFRIDSVPEGMHEIQAQHAAFDSLGLSGLSARIEVRRGTPKVMLAVPSFATLWRAACGAAPAPKDSALVYGSVRDARTQSPTAQARVDVSWIDLIGGGKSLTNIGQRRWSFTVSSDERGEYALCGVPPGVPITLSAALDSALATSLELEPSLSRVRRHDVLLAPVVRAAADTSADMSATTNAPAAVAAGVGDGRPNVGTSGTVSGVVTDARGMPIANAVIGVDTLIEVRSNDEGRFTVRHVPIGTRQAAVVSIGMQPQTLTFNVTPGDTTHVTVPMSVVQLLDAVRVRANRSTPAASRVRMFEEHRLVGLGSIIDSTGMVGQRSMVTVMRTIPGLQVLAGRGINGPSISSPRCAGFKLMLDGHPFTNDELVTLDPETLAGVEVYKRPLIYPSDIVSGGGCSILLWTKRAFAQRP